MRTAVVYSPPAPMYVRITCWASPQECAFLTSSWRGAVCCCWSGTHLENHYSEASQVLIILSTTPASQYHPSFSPSPGELPRKLAQGGAPRGLSVLQGFLGPRLRQPGWAEAGWCWARWAQGHIPQTSPQQVLSKPWQATSPSLGRGESGVVLVP